MNCWYNIYRIYKSLRYAALNVGNSYMMPSPDIFVSDILDVVWLNAQHLYMHHVYGG